ncbi:MAG: BREX-1 system adenine-specific DNA-methyltransferase PglX [Prevotellaceae bacterium]|nr:BREX-1 system adenine-specific DNA-methyltransferase PglX [Prevotellaceae bacterium]
MNNQHIVWHTDVLMKQLISYAVGCMMGRYRLDRKGLAIAHPDATAEEIAPYEVNGGKFEIDEDAIIPLMTQDSPFHDNATVRFNDFLRLAFGADTLTKNLNYVEQQLGKSIEEYMMKDFWNDHKRMYQNRPIYWLFQSRRGAFRCITYMHRMNRFTVQQIRENYLLRQIDYLKQRMDDMKPRMAELNVLERRQLARFQRDLEDCQEYDLRLHDVANRQITFDLDDGVMKNYALFGDVLARL